MRNILFDIYFFQIIAIKGEQRAQVIAAKSKIDAIIKRGRLKQSVTHFVSLHMVNQNVIDNFLTFKVNLGINKLFIKLFFNIFVDFIKKEISS